MFDTSEVEKVKVSYDNTSNSIYLALTVLEVDSTLFKLVMKGDVEGVENYTCSTPPELLFLPKKSLFFSKNVATRRHHYQIYNFTEMMVRFAQVMQEAKS